jgi:hypothetical protein
MSAPVSDSFEEIKVDPSVKHGDGPSTHNPTQLVVREELFSWSERFKIQKHGGSPFESDSKIQGNAGNSTPIFKIYSTRPLYPGQRSSVRKHNQSRPMHTEVLALLTIVGVSFAVGLTWGMPLSIVLVVITRLFHHRRHLQAQLDESPPEKQGHTPTKQIYNQQWTALTRNGGSLKKNGRRKSVRRLLKTMSAPFGMVTNRKRLRKDDRQQAESER